MKTSELRRKLLHAFPASKPPSLQRNVRSEEGADAFQAIADLNWTQIDPVIVERHGRAAVDEFDDRELSYYLPAFLDAYLAVADTADSDEDEQNLFDLAMQLLRPPIATRLGTWTWWGTVTQLSPAQRSVVGDFIEFAQSRMDDGDPGLAWTAEFWRNPAAYDEHYVHREES